MSNQIPCLDFEVEVRRHGMVTFFRSYGKRRCFGRMRATVADVQTSDGAINERWLPEETALGWKDGVNRIQCFARQGCLSVV